MENKEAAIPNCQWDFEECHAKAVYHLMHNRAFTEGSHDSLYICEKHAQEAKINFPNHKLWTLAALCHFNPKKEKSESF